MATQQACQCKLCGIYVIKQKVRSQTNGVLSICGILSVLAAPRQKVKCGYHTVTNPP